MHERLRMNAAIVEQRAGTRLSPAELRGRWQRTLHDPMLLDVPGKLELTEKGRGRVAESSLGMAIGPLPR